MSDVSRVPYEALEKYLTIVIQMKDDLRELIDKEPTLNDNDKRELDDFVSVQGSKFKAKLSGLLLNPSLKKSHDLRSGQKLQPTP